MVQAVEEWLWMIPAGLFAAMFLYGFIVGDKGP